MGSIYRESGLANAPAFFNYTPFRLDFSPYRRNQEMMMQMMPMLLEQQQAAAAQAKAYKMPELKGYANDATPRYQQAREGEAIMQQRLASGMNPRWVANYDEEFKRGQQMRLSAFAPDDQLRLEQELKIGENFEQQIADRTKKGEAAGDFVFTNASGIPQLDPEDPTRFLNAGEYATRRRYFPDYNIDGHGAYLKPNGQLVSPQDFTERFDKLINTDALREAGGPGDAKVQMDPITGLASIVQRTYKNAANAEQLNAGFELARKQIDSSAEIGLFNAYKNTSHFRDNIKNGNYLTDGRLDWNKVRNGMIAGDGFGHKSKNSPNGRSFTDDMMFDIVDKHLRTSELVTESRWNINGGKDGDGSMSSKLRPLLEVTRIPPRTVDEKGNVRIHGKVEKATFPIMLRKNGQDHLSAITVDDGQVTANLPVPWANKFNADIRSAYSLGKTGPDAIEEDPSIGTVQSVFPGREVLMPGGKTNSTNDPGFQGARILEVSPQMLWRKHWDMNMAMDPNAAEIPAEEGGLGIRFAQRDTTSSLTSTYMDPKLPKQSLSSLNQFDRYVKVKMLLDDSAPKAVEDYKRRYAEGEAGSVYEPRKIFGPFTSHAEYLKSQASKERSTLTDLQGNPVPELLSSNVESLDVGSRTDATDYLPFSGISDRVVDVWMKVEESDNFMRDGAYMVDPDQLKTLNPFHAQPTQQQYNQAVSGYRQVINSAAQQAASSPTP